MKPLANPWIVGGLCVIAAGVVGYQLLGSRRSVGPPPAPTSSAPPPIAPGPSTLIPHPSTNSPETTAPATRIDQAYVQSHFPQWLQAPQRDPFLWATAGEHGASPSSPVSQWRLKSIWNQTGSRLAVINNRVHAEGDLIGAYRLEAVESDGVWLRGPNGREALGFAKPGPATASITNHPSMVTNRR